MPLGTFSIHEECINGGQNRVQYIYHILNVNTSLKDIRSENLSPAFCLLPLQESALYEIRLLSTII